MPQAPRILLIEDEPAIADTLLYALRTEGFETGWVTTGAEGLSLALSETWSLIVLDVGLPDTSGFEVCRKLRMKSEVPVLFLTARNGEIDRVVGLELGGDDYVVKPFSPREVTARIRAILRRSRSASPAGRKVPANECGAFTLDEERCQIRLFGSQLPLTRTEYRLLSALLARPGRVFPREALLDAAWEEPEASMDRTVDAHVKALRAKIRAVSPGFDPIETHRGLGYSLRVED